MEICNSCAVNLTSPEAVCGGFCKATFHYKCARISETFYKEIVANSASYWMCPECREIMGNARFKNTLVSMNAATKEVNDGYQKLVEDLKSEIKDSLIAELRLEIQGGFSKLSLAILSPAPNRFQFNYRSASKRSREPDDVPAHQPAQPAKVFRGTNEPSSSTGVPVTTPESKFWIYLTKISPEVTEDEVVNLAKNCLQVDNVVAKALVPRGRPLSSLTFISFKVGVSQELKHKAMDPSTWPQEIQFREFVETGSSVRHFWKPGQAADPGASNNKESHPMSGPASSQQQPL